ncbi:hypothetical protein YT14_002369 [Salmonella enterica subsp. enterica serovar Oslo]|nr:hypothetical protein [Salmonella enterica subsp. enterica serovar Oslo]
MPFLNSVNKTREKENGIVCMQAGWENLGLTDTVSKANHIGPNGDVYGSLWGNNWISNWLNGQFASRDNNINIRATWDWCNAQLNPRATIDWVQRYFVQDIRQSGIMSLYAGSDANTQTPEGGVVIGAIVHGKWDNNEELKYTWLQKKINGTWQTIGRT